MELKDDLKKAIDENLVFVATANSNGTPNVVPIGFCKTISDDTLLIADNFMNKTFANLKENPQLSLIIEDVKNHPFQLKGTVKIDEEGEYFKEVTDWVAQVKDELAPKSAIIFKVTEIYSIAPGPSAGNKIE